MNYLGKKLKINYSKAIIKLEHLIYLLKFVNFPIKIIYA